jgi:histidine ammonia-lyase
VTGEIRLGRHPLTRSDYDAVVYGTANVMRDDGGRLDQHRDRLKRLIDTGAPIYSVTTGYGAEATQAIPPDALGRMQENTVRSHAVGVGLPAPRAVSRGMTLLMAAAAATGAPGFSGNVLDGLISLLDHNIDPEIPLQGSQSASDLVPGAHLALALLEPPDNAGSITAIQLGPKDGSLVNNSAFSTALAVHASREVANLIAGTEAVAALTLQAVRGHPDAYQEELIALRPHPGAIQTASHMRQLLAGSRIRPTPDRPHDPFSLRCLPQVHGAVRDALRELDRALSIEIGSVTDNPVVIGEEVVSGGNFHGTPLALPLDYVGLGLPQLAMLSARRTQHLVLGDLPGAGTPPKLSPAPAERLGMLMLPSLAAALVSECRQRTHPASRESIPVDLMEDHVSMAALAARQVLDGAELARTVVAAELAAAAQALDFGDPSAASPAASNLYTKVRERLAFLDDDRPIDVAQLIHLVDHADATDPL